MKRLSILVCLALTLLFVTSATADVTLQDGSSTVQFNPNSQAGAYAWTVNGYDVLFQQWFWYGTNPNGGQQSIDNLGNLLVTQTDNQHVTFNYGAAGGLQAEVDYGLHGGAIGQMTSDLSENIKLTNAGNAPVDLRFYQYSDFDLNRSNLVDQVKIDPSLRFVNQWPVGAGSFGPLLSETIITPAPNHAEANYYANTLNEFAANSGLTLNDVLVAGPGDVTWAFEWDRTLDPGASFLISKDKQLTPTPEPGTLGVVGGILAILAWKKRSLVL